MCGIGVSLVGLVAGYWVLDRANANKGNLKQIGTIIGWLVITASVVSAVSGALCRANGKGGKMCPFSGKSMMMERSAGPVSEGMSPIDAKKK